MRSRSARSIGFESGPRPQGRLGSRRRPAVEGADVLADVASEDPLADRLPLLGRDRLAELDRQVGDALPRVKAIGLDDRAGRASVDAGPASTAMAGRHRLIVDQRFAGEQGGQKEPASQLAVQEQACSCRPSPGRPIRRTRVPRAGPCRPRRGPPLRASTGDDNRPRHAVARGSDRDSRRPRHSVRSGPGRRQARRVPPCGRTWPA